MDIVSPCCHGPIFGGFLIQMQYEESWDIPEVHTCTFCQRVAVCAVEEHV